MCFFKKISCLVITSILLSSLSAKDNNPHSIKFKIKGLSGDSVYYLANHFAEKYIIQDTARLDSKEVITFNGSQQLKSGMYTLIQSGTPVFDFIVDQSQHFTIETDVSDIKKNMRIYGSDENQKYYEYIRYVLARQDEVDQLQSRLKAGMDNNDSFRILSDRILVVRLEMNSYKHMHFKQNPVTLLDKIFNAMDAIIVPPVPLLSNGRPDSTFDLRYLHLHYFDNYDFSDERLLRTPILVNTMKFYLDNLSSQDPDSLSASADFIVEKSKCNKEAFKFVVYWITSTYEAMPVLGMEGVFVHMVEKYYKTGLVFWADPAEIARLSRYASILKNILIGKFAADLPMKDTAFHDLSLYSVRAKFTIVYFWDYACSHCQIITPQLISWYHKTGKSFGAEVFAVSCGNSDMEWKKYIKENKLDWINVSNPDQIGESRRVYNVVETPKMFILDENKKILCNRTLKADQMDSFFDYLLKR